jgi:hypothetical protein
LDREVQLLFHLLTWSLGLSTATRYAGLRLAENMSFASATSAWLARGGLSGSGVFLANGALPFSQVAGSRPAVYLSAPAHAVHAQIPQNGWVCFRRRGFGPIRASAFGSGSAARVLEYRVARTAFAGVPTVHRSLSRSMASLCSLGRVTQRTHVLSATRATFSFPASTSAHGHS